MWTLLKLLSKLCLLNCGYTMQSSYKTRCITNDHADSCTDVRSKRCIAVQLVPKQMPLVPSNPRRSTAENHSLQDMDLPLGVQNLPIGMRRTPCRLCCGRPSMIAIPRQNLQVSCSSDVLQTSGAVSLYHKLLASRSVSPGICQIGVEFYMFSGCKPAKMAPNFHGKACMELH